MAVDLDGTLVTGNSLHLYIRCGLSDALRRGDLWRATRILGAIAMRKTGFWSHLAMKRSVLKTIRPNRRIMDVFKARFEAMLSTRVMSLINDARGQGTTVLLATAAPDVYVSQVWDGDFVATDSESQRECRGEEKRRRVLEYASEHGLSLTAVVTDHHDDLPLLAVESVRERYLISPSAETLAQVAQVPGGIYCVSHISE